LNGPDGLRLFSANLTPALLSRKTRSSKTHSSCYGADSLRLYQVSRLRFQANEQSGIDQSSSLANLRGTIPVACRGA